MRTRSLLQIRLPAPSCVAAAPTGGGRGGGSHAGGGGENVVDVDISILRALL